jgi:hypothetical protein
LDWVAEGVRSPPVGSFVSRGVVIGVFWPDIGQLGFALGLSALCCGGRLSVGAGDDVAKCRRLEPGLPRGFVL